MYLILIELQQGGSQSRGAIQDWSLNWASPGEGKNVFLEYPKMLLIMHQLLEMDHCILTVLIPGLEALIIITTTQIP